MKSKNILILGAALLLAVLPAAAQNTNDDKNKAIIETTEGSQELNTDEISVIRFNGGKVTVVQPSGETTFDHTLRSLSFQRPNPGTLRLTATTSIGTEGSGNRAQAIDGEGKLKTTWESGDKVYVYATENGTTSIGTLTPKEDDWGEKSATLTGDINADGLTDGVTTLYFSTKDRATLDLSTQDGTVGSLFYFTATGTITIDGANASVSNLSFKRPIAIVKFTLKDKADGTSPVYAKSFTVNDGTNDYVVTPATLSNVLYVGVPAIDDQTVTLAATDGLSRYTYEKTGVTFANNKYYAINVKMTNTTDYLTVPLTFEAKEAGAEVTFTKATTIDDLPIEYSLNGGTWTAYTSGTAITLTNVGDKVSFRGTNTKYATNISMNEYSYFSCLDDCYIYGNIMSLIDKNDFFAKTTLTADHTFSCLFNGNTIYNHATKALLLPATTLTAYCYQCMFMGCTGLTSAPALPAETMQQYCYQNMFVNCKNLTTAPALPATTLADGCYYSMFKGCTGLTTAPSLPATELANKCYQSMFQNCTSLNSITCLATDISASNCTQNWLNGVAAAGTFYKPKSTDWSEKTGANGIPEGWTVINDGVLPGQFTVNAGGGKVNFSMGSLQYQANSTGATEAPYMGVWRFAGHQYDNIGASNANISESYTGWIDLFGWGTSGYAHRTSDYQPWSHTQTNATFIAYNSLTKNLYDEDGKADWGYNAISNGGNTENSGWRTPKNDEWGYLFNTRTTTSGIRYAKATVNGVTGVILLPDDWDASYYALASTNTANATWSSNVITLSDWGSKLEAHGAVFLPTSGNRDGNNAPTSGFVNIWSSDNDDSDNAHCVFIPEASCNPTDHAYRYAGLIVRLVKNNISEGSISYATSEVNKTTVDAAFTNELTLVGDGTVSYAVTDGADICTVDENTGEVTLNGTAGSCTITATVADSPFYTYAPTTASYTLTVTEATIAQTPLTLEAKTAGTIVIENPKDGMQYTKNGGAKTQVPASIDVAEGDVVRFYGDGTNITSYTGTLITGGDAECYIYGNIMSLVDEVNFATNTELTGDNAFSGLFAFNTTLYNHAEKALLLPATTLADGCYQNMFSGCTNLTEAPALPATTLANSCYSNMFSNCTSLTTAPELSATTLTTYCYQLMFSGCTSLNSVTCLATDISASNCTQNWLNGVAATGTFYKPESMADWTTGANGIPSSWTVINDGVLPGQFTVNASGGKVSFSMGNLQYQANSTGAAAAPYTGVWRFAGHQYEAIGSGNSNVSASYDGWIDSFGWGSGNQPTQTSEDHNVYSTFVDWGTNAISNGGNTANMWRTLSESEWTYLIFTRPNADSKRGRATINGMYCFVLLPDDWTLPTGLTFTPNADNWINEYTAAQWAQMEAAGAICLPASGSRAGGANNTNINNFNEWGCYWSSTSANSTQAYNLWITSNHVGTTDKGNYQMGASVRLAQNITAAGSISYATTAVEKLSVDAAFTNELTLVGDGTVTYARSDGADICTVDPTTGEVTLNGTAGTCTITATVTNGSFYTYAPTTASYTLTVTAATLSVTASDYSGTYDGTAHGITVTCDGATIKYRTTDSGEYGLTENPTYSAVGTYTVYYQVTRDYYQTVTGSNTVSISKATLTATAADVSRDYGSSNPTFTVNVTGFVNGETAATAAGYTAPTASTTANSSSNAGDYAITPSGGSATNYDFTYVNGTLTINKVAATLTCSNDYISFDPTDNVGAQKIKTGVGCNGGIITVSGGSSSTFAASYNNGSHTITITRRTTDEIPVTTVTVSVTPDKNHTAPNSVTFSVRAYAYDPGVALANSSVGYKVGSNGKAYHPNATLPNGVTVIGMVAQKSGTSGIVLYNSDNMALYNWANRNEGNPNGVQVYVNDLSSKTTKSWTCGTKAQYQSCGVDGSSAWNNLQSRLSSAGCTQFSSGSDYWSADASSNSKAYYFKDGAWKTKSKSLDISKVRPLFAF